MNNEKEQPNHLMTFADYQNLAHTTATYPKFAPLQPVKADEEADAGEIIYPVLGLVSEAGEVADKVKKIIRDGNGVIGDAQFDNLELELGDVLWYIAETCTALGIPLERVAARNIVKLKSRKERDKISGSGDHR